MFQYLEYSISDKIYKIEPLDKLQQFKTGTDGFHTRYELVEGKFVSPEEITKNAIWNVNEISKDKKDIRNFSCAYSKARSGFNANKITSTGLSKLDATTHETDNNNDFTSIKQLMVDINTQDNSDWRKETERKLQLGELLKKNYSEFKMTSRMSRFSNAFNGFFDYIKYDHIDENTADEKRIIFYKFDKEISIDELSTGEKQIVFRGAFLLKNINRFENSVVFIDEPELSLHPKWQEKILRYYQGLFINNNIKNAQLFIATHSEYVLKAALNDRENNLIISLKNANGHIVAENADVPSVLPSVTSAELNYIIFGIASNDYHIELYALLNDQLNDREGKEQLIINVDKFILESSVFDAQKHSKEWKHNNTTYKTLPSYIRNAIDHPDEKRTFTDKELYCSIELLRTLCQANH